MPVANNLSLYLELIIQKLYFFGLLDIDDRGICMSILSDGYSMLQKMLNRLSTLELQTERLILFSSTKRKKKDDTFRHTKRKLGINRWDLFYGNLSLTSRFTSASSL